MIRSTMTALTIALAGTHALAGHSQETGFVRAARLLHHPDQPGVLVAAHRACWRAASENSLDGIRACIAANIDIAEIDVRRTADGHLVLMHDATVDRMTNGHGKVADLRLADIRRLRLKSAAGGNTETTLTARRVPMLEEALRTAKGRIILNLDAKAPVQEAAFAAVQRAGMADQVIMKTDAAPDDAALVSSRFGKAPLFMPVLTACPAGGAQADRCTASLNAVLPRYRRYKPFAFELNFADPAFVDPAAIRSARSGARFWVNALKPGQAGGLATQDSAQEDKVWSTLIDQGFSIIQTDDPIALLRYLRKAPSVSARATIEQVPTTQSTPTAVTLTAGCGVGGSPYKIDKTLAAMRNEQVSTDDLTLIAAHRGYWENYPENSWEAIRIAGFECPYEIVEVDVKPAADSVPVVFHDFDLDRVTDGHGALNVTSAEAFSRMSLRNRHGLLAHDSHPMTTNTFLSRYATTMDDYHRGAADWRGPVIAFDVKARKAEDVWPMVKTIYAQMLQIERDHQNRSLHGIVFKIESRSMPERAADVVNLATPDLPLNITIVLNPPRPGEQDINEAVVQRYNAIGQIISWEVNYRYNGDPMGRWLKDPRLRSIGTFSTYYELPEGVGKSEYPQCCGMLFTDDEADRRQGKILDYRARWDWYLSRNVEGGRRFNLITTDRPDVVEPYLRQLDLRNVGKLR